MPKIKELQFKYDLESSLNDGSIFSTLKPNPLLCGWLFYE